MNKVNNLEFLIGILQNGISTVNTNQFPFYTNVGAASDKNRVVLFGNNHCQITCTDIRGRVVFQLQKSRVIGVDLLNDSSLVTALCLDANTLHKPHRSLLGGITFSHGCGSIKRRVCTTRGVRGVRRTAVKRSGATISSWCPCRSTLIGGGSPSATVSRRRAGEGISLLRTCSGSPTAVFTKCIAICIHRTVVHWRTINCSTRPPHVFATAVVHRCRTAVHGSCSSMHWRGTAMHRSCTTEEWSCRGKTSRIASGPIGIFGSSELITDNGNSFADNHDLSGTRMKLDLDVSSGCITHNSEKSFVLTCLDTDRLSNKTVVSAPSSSGRTTSFASVLRLWSSKRTKWTFSSSTRRSAALRSGSSQNAAPAPDDEYASILSSRLRVQEQLSTAHPLDSRRLTLVRTLGNADCVSNSNLATLYIEGDGTVGTGIALAAKLLWTDLTNNTVVVHNGKLFPTDADNHSDFVGRASATENNKVM
mmetsp:Transcript_16782/g.36511  ORF Transcript_16782/g.36511 Transcript_16782/m.36511 type:complete len:477 (-) Transcript_16782:1947-3377(-)